MSTLTKTDWLYIGILFLIAVTIRWWTISHDHIFFHFDQARDAFVAESMIQDRDLKLQGPSASGTNESVYHGVLYYYVIAPFYALGQGDPGFVAHAIAVLGATAVIPIFWLWKDSTGKTSSAVIITALAACSFEQIQASTWLSNPTLVVSLVSWFYLSLWFVFFRGNLKWWPILALTLGVNHQAVIVMLFLWGSVFSGLFWYLCHRTNTSALTPLKIAGFLGVYVLTIASMIVVQLRLALQGIFSLDSLSQAAALHPESTNELIFKVADLYIKKIGLGLTPAWPVVSVVIFGWLLTRWSRQKPELQWFINTWLLAPLGLLALHSRNAYHALLGLEVPLYALVTLSVMSFFRSQKSRFLAGGLLVGIFGLSQLLALQSFRSQTLTSFSVERGLFLFQQKQAIDHVYQASAGEPFSFNALTSPFGYNLTWAYLFHWYGQNTYNRLPVWTGNSQAGTLWAEVLPVGNQTLPHHFTFEEKVSGIDLWLRQPFYASQPRSATDAAQFSYGATLVTTY